MKTKVEVLDVFVEKGAPDGHKIVLHGKADESPGVESGDVIVVVRQQEHKRFLRRGADLYLEEEISLADALTGFRIVVPHLDGRKLVVKSKPGEVLQPGHGGPALKGVQGEGMPFHKDPFTFGNLFLVISIRFPVALPPDVTPELRRLLGASDPDSEDNAVVEAKDGDEVEHCVAEDIDPLESSKRAEVGAEAYEEDDGDGRLQCRQQ